MPEPTYDSKTSAAPGRPALADAPQHRMPALRGMSYAEGSAALRPAVQLRPASKKPAPDDQLDDKEVIAAYTDMRTSGLNPTWIAALQTALGAPATGIASRELALAIGDHERTAGLPVTGKLNKKTKASLKGMYAELTTVPERLQATGTTAARATANSGAPENESVKTVGSASYADYVKGFKTTTFCGQPVVGHPEFLARIENAKVYLSTKFPGQSDAEIGATLGVMRTSHFRTSTKTSDQMYHGLGFALDINPVQNNWNFNKGARGKKMGNAMKHAGQLFGENVIASVGDIQKNSKGKTTEELFSGMAASNDALKRYRAFAGDDAALKTHLESTSCPEAAKKLGFDHWKKAVKADDREMGALLANGPLDKGPAGFMDLQQQTILALRDAAGLRWGGADLGGDSGDLMHFDGDTMSTAKSLRGATRKVRAEWAAAEKAKKDAEAPPATGG